MRDRRASVRRALRYPARIDFADGNAWWDCSLRDISEGGAKLAFRGPDAMPEEFFLLLTLGGESARRCRVVWRDDDHLGVLFLGTAAPRPPVDALAAPLDC